MNPPITVIDLMRHGEPVGGRKYRGQTDDPLSDRGWAEMRQTVGDFAGWDAIVSSPLSRCRAFAEDLAARTGIPLTFDERIKEVGFGVWENRYPADLRAENPDCLRNFRRDALRHRPAGAEPLEDFYERVGAALEDVVAAHEGQHLLLVCHAGVVRMALARILGIPLSLAYRVQVASASVTRIAYEGRGAERYGCLLFLDGGLARGRKLSD